MGSGYFAICSTKVKITGDGGLLLQRRLRKETPLCYNYRWFSEQPGTWLNNEQNDKSPKIMELMQGRGSRQILYIHIINYLKKELT